jgi:hypothetical protein
VSEAEEGDFLAQMLRKVKEEELDFLEYTLRKREEEGGTSESRRCRWMRQRETF